MKMNEKNSGRKLSHMLCLVVFALGFTSCEKSFEVKVTTCTPTEITYTTAVCGGKVVMNGEGAIEEVGVCWATTVDPTVGDQKKAAEGCNSTFSDTLIDLEPGTTYHVRAYAWSGSNFYYGKDKSFTTLALDNHPTLPTVHTAEVYEITNTTAIVGGQIIDDGGAKVTDCGICYTTEQGEETRVSIEAIDSVFSMTLVELTPNTKYNVRSYATNEVGTNYGEEVRFTTLDEGGSGIGDWVDLGLPSGLLWATRNVGAEFPWDYGDYFAWGETIPKAVYSTYTYIYNDNWGKLTKYCTVSSFGLNGFVDNLVTLQSIDDAATANWGSGARMPTKEEWEELYQNTISTWTVLGDDYHSVSGRLFTASNGNSLFLPAAGHHMDGSLYNTQYGYYWSSSLRDSSPSCAWFLKIDRGYPSMDWYFRVCGKSVRAVRSVRES